jgi:catechol 2,3-dioxygenase-like lactoylglutathione lyase family enzyme
MPNVSGLLETALYVADLDASERFYHDLFGFISATQMDTQLNWQRRVSGRFINRDEQDRQDGISAAEYQIAAKKILMFFYPVHPC